MNYDFTAISNYFTVKHPKQVQDILNGLGFYTDSADDGSICFYSSDSQYHDEMYVLRHVHTGIILGHYDVYNEFLEDAIEERLYELNIDGAVITDEVTEDDVEEITLFDYLQEELYDDSYIIYKEVGNEGFRYNSASGATITKSGITWLSLDNLLEKAVHKNPATIELYHVTDDDVDMYAGPQDVIDFAEERIRYCDMDVNDFVDIQREDTFLANKMDTLRHDTNNVSRILTVNEAVKILNIYHYDVQVENFN